MNAVRKCIISIVVAVSGCAAPLTWDKYGATEADFNKDRYECEKDARQSGYFSSGREQLEFGKRCMVARGWRSVEKDKSGP